MNKILAAVLFALCAVCAQAKPFSPEQYAKVLREYNSIAGANNYFESGKFKEEFELRKKYCDEGLRDACGDLGLLYVTGLGAPRDSKRAGELLGYAAKNDEFKAISQYYEAALDIARAAEKYPDDRVAQHLGAEFKNSLEQCKAYKGDRHVCFRALVISGMLPKGEGGMGLSQAEFAKAWEDIVVSDVERNGMDDSKVNSLAKELEGLAAR